MGDPYVCIPRGAAAGTGTAAERAAFVRDMLAEAELCLGDRLRNGDPSREGEGRDASRAFRLYCRAASKGNADAMLRLGEIYSRGEEGVAERNERLAAKWRARARARGTSGTALWPAGMSRGEEGSPDERG